MSNQVEFWNGPAGERWVREQTTLDAFLHPFGEAALRASRAASGEAVLDVGCGCGDSSLVLASLVAPRGRVLGVDVSERMLARAKERGAGMAGVSFQLADASKDPLEASAFDLLFSRFGVMFFADPTAAFIHLRAALRQGGRLAFACWRSLAENPWSGVPFDAVAAVLGRPDPPPEDAPGPFSFGDPARVRRILEGSGFRDVEVKRFDCPVTFAAGGSLEDAAQEIAQLGMVARLLQDKDEADVARGMAAVRSVLPQYASSAGGARFPAAAWVVTARTA
jgi:SAM-dependent methyltransferase